MGQDGFPLLPHVPFYPKLFFACFLADGKGIRKRHRHVTTASSFHLNWTKLPFRTKPTRSTICGHLSMYRRNVRRNSSMKLDKSFIGRKQMRISSAIKEGSGDAITSVSEKRASPSEQWRSGLMSPCRRSRSKFAEVSENLPEDTTSSKNASSVSTLQFHIEKRRLPKLRSFFWETALRSAQRIIGITVQIESRKTTVPMPNKKPSGQDVSDCHRRKLGLASVVKVEQYPEITLAIQHGFVDTRATLVRWYVWAATYESQRNCRCEQAGTTFLRAPLSSATAILRCYGGYKPGMSVRRQEAKHPSALVHRPWSVKPPLDHNRARC